MSGNLIQYAYITGEMAPQLFARTDFEKYDLGVALAQNWFVDYRGGLASRPGLEFREFIQHDDKETKMFDFVFSPDIANTYAVLFGNNYIRFIQDGNYTLEADITISDITNANPGVITATAHGLSNGDFVKLSNIVGMTELNGRTVEVSAVTTNTFELLDHFAAVLDTTAFTAYSSAGTINRVYTIPSPYNTGDLADLRHYQIRDTIRLTRKGYSVKNLTRSGATSWAITEETFENGVTTPGQATSTPETAGTAGAVFGVTAIDINGNESLMSKPTFEELSSNWSDTAGSVLLSWSPITGAVKYNVYRTLILSKGADLTAGMQFGYVGTTFGTDFTDNNIIPDFVRTPPTSINPFADNSIERIDVTAAGTGMGKNTTITVAGGSGSGFRGIAVVNDAGALLAVIVLNGGSGYTAPVTVTFGGGTGTADAVVGPASGNDPAISTTFQQRQIYASSENDPLDLWGSKTGLLSNFDFSNNQVDSDSYNFTIDSRSVQPIRHLLNVRGGLLAFAHNTIWRIRGDNQESVTGTSIIVEPQSFLGASNVEPLNIDVDAMYIQSKDNSARLLNFNDFSKQYSGTDISLLSSHLFSAETPILRMQYASAPHRLVHCVRSDGIMLVLTIVRDQDVTGWTWYCTDGRFKDVLTLEEEGVDRTYVIVERKIGGVLHKFVERFAERDVKAAEDAFAVDSGLTFVPTYPAATLEAAAAEGEEVEFTASAAVFVAGDVDKVIRMGDGKAVITTVVTSTSILCHIVRPILYVNCETDIPWPALSGEWTMDATIATFGNLHHLEGETVAILGDGNCMEPQVVVNGSVTLPDPVSKVAVGLPYSCIMQTLPPNAQDGVIESKRKRVIGLALRVNETRGLKTGATLDHLYDMKERTTELYGEPITLRNTIAYELSGGAWDMNGQTYVVQDQPLPAHILGSVTELDVGDDLR